MKELPRVNLHTHTRYCDGANTPEELVLSAIEAGMDTLGFSGHSYLAHDPSWCMDAAAEAAYRTEVKRLKKQYADRLHILLGLEQDFFSEAPKGKWDYIIGAVHCIQAGEEYCPVDLSRASFSDAVAKHFSGDFYRFCRAYYELTAQVADRTSCDVVAHFDLVTKYNQDGVFFDENDPRYLSPMLEAVDALLEKDVLFELNTGAISRGYRRFPYPSTVVLRRIAQRRGRITFGADAHKKENLMFGFEDAMSYARACGIGEVTLRTRAGWRTYPL